MVTSTIFERAQKYVTFSNRRRTLSAGQMGQQHISDTLKISGAPYGETLEELISDGEKFNLKYIIANKEQTPLHSFTDELYNNYNQHAYLKKIFDSDELGFKKLKIKVFEIDYEKFNKLLGE